MITAEDFFTNAIHQDWQMSWKAWQVLLKEMCGYTIVDDDSGIKDAESVCSAVRARACFAVCTVKKKGFR